MPLGSVALSELKETLIESEDPEPEERPAALTALTRDRSDRSIKSSRSGQADPFENHPENTLEYPTHTSTHLQHPEEKSHENPRWGVKSALNPVALVLLGLGTVLLVPADFAYPRDGEPSVLMDQFGEEICGYPRMLGDKDPIVHSPLAKYQVFDAKVMTKSIHFCPSNDTTTPAVQNLLWMEVNQGTKKLFQRYVPFKCTKEYVQDIYTFDLSDFEGFDQEARESGQKIFVELHSNSSIAFPATFDLMEYGVMGRYRPILAAIILTLVYSLIFADALNRAICTLCGSILALIVLAFFRQAPHMKTANSWISETTLGLLFGMMVSLHVLADTGILEHLAVLATQWTKGRPWLLLLSLALGTGFLSIFLPNLAIVALVVPVTVSVCEISRLDPVPFVIMEAIMSGVGSTMTMITNPPNVIIGHAFADQGVTMGAFLANVGVGCVLTVPVLIFGMKFMFPEIYEGEGVEVDIDALKTRYPIKDKELLKTTLLILMAVIGLMFFSPVHGMDSSWFAFGGALTLLLLVYPQDIEGMMMRIEWDTFFYLAGLFVLVEACGRMRLISEIGRALADAIGTAPESMQLTVAIFAILWVVTVVSAFLDTIPLCMALVKVIEVVSRRLGLPLPPLAWALAFGACLGQNSTIVGSANNVVAVSLCERSGYTITTGQWLAIGVPCVLMTQVTISVYMYFAYIM